MNPIFSQAKSKLDPSVGAMTTGNELFLKSRAANPGFFLSIEDAPPTDPKAVSHDDEHDGPGAASPLVQIALISFAEDLKKLSTD